MIKRKNLTNRLIALLLIVLGLIFGVTWNSAKFCIGDEIFIALGVVLSSAISIYLLFFGMKKGAQLFSQAPVGSSSFLRHDTKIPPVVSFGRYFV